MMAVVRAVLCVWVLCTVTCSLAAGPPKVGRVHDSAEPPFNCGRKKSYRRPDIVARTYGSAVTDITVPRSA